MAKKEKELVKKEEQPLGFALSQEEQAQMYGNMDQEDFKIPRLAVLESLSPEVSDGLGKPGDLFIKGLNINLGTGPVKIVVLMRQKSRIRWNPLEQGGGIACRADDGLNGMGDPGGSCLKCPMHVWTGSEKPKCDLYENVIAVLPEYPELPPIAISGSRGRLSKFRDFNTMLEVHRYQKRPLFDKEYEVSVLKKTNLQGAKYHIFQFNPNKENKLLPSEEVEKYYNMFKSMSAKPIIIEHDEVEIKEADTAVEI